VARHVAYEEEVINVNSTTVGKTGISRRTLKNDIKMNLNKSGRESVELNKMAQDTVQRSCQHANEHSCIVKGRKYLDQSNDSLLLKILLQGTGSAYYEPSG
jgi:hypothetical protein